MKIKIPFTNKQIILDPVFEGMFIMLGIYSIFAITILLFAAIGAKNFFLAVGIFLFVGLVKTSKIEKTGGNNVKEQKED